MKYRVDALLLGLVGTFLFQAPVLSAAEPLKALIVDGQNNHDWKKTTPVLRQTLESSGRFNVQVATSPPTGEDLSGFRPKFADFDVVVSNYNGEPWSQETKNDFVNYVKSGGGFVVIHAADNAFPQWKEYNRIIGLGGWGNRNEKSGPYVRFRDGKIVRDTSPGPGGSHGKQHAFEIIHRVADHPILRGLPEKWIHVKDELYDRLRGPAESLTVLATAYSDPNTNGTGQHEPIMMTITYGQGRVFHTVLGHSPAAMSGAGFRALLIRGAEWAATGKVTIPIPNDFPGTDPFERIKRYTFNDDGAFLEEIAAAVRGAINDPAKRSAMEARLIALLAPENTIACKTFICRQLRLLGSAQCVEVLSEMLRDEKLSDLARYALEGNPTPQAGQALRRALGTTTGTVRIGIINSIGQRRDQNATGALAALVNDADPDTAAATLVALRKIGGLQAYAALRKVTNPKDARVVDAMLSCAESLAEQGKTSEAIRIYQGIEGDTAASSRHRMAALRGRLRLEGDGALPTISKLLAESDGDARTVALEFVRRLPGKNVTEKLASQLNSLPADAQRDLIEGLADRNDTAAMPALLIATRHDQPGVRLAAIRGLGRIDNADGAVELLLASAAKPSGEERDAARQALANMSGQGINPILVQEMSKADPTVRMEALRALTARGARDQMRPIFLAAKDADKGVRLLALESIGTLGIKEHYALLVYLVTQAESREERDRGREAIIRLSDRVEAPELRVQPILSAISSAPIPGKTVCLSLLSEFGGDAALEAVRQAVQDKDARIRKSAVNAMAAWPDAGPLDDLRDLVTNAEHPDLRPSALRGYIRMIGLPSDRPVKETIALYKKAMALADGVEAKRLVLAGVAEMVETAALRFAKSYANDPEIGADAKKAAGKIKKALEGPPIASASHNSGKAKLALDGNPGTRWDTGTPMRPGMWFMLDLKSQKSIKSIVLDTKGSSGDYPRGYTVYVSNNAKDMGRPVIQGKGDGPVTTIQLSGPVRGRYLKIVQTGKADGLFWSIHELKIDSE